MGFRKRNANKSDNRSKAKVVMGKPASQLTKEDKKILSARIAEIKSANGGKTTVQNTIPYMCMYKDGVCQVSENFFSMTVQFYDANYSISEFEEQNNTVMLSISLTIRSNSSLPLKIKTDQRKSS